MAQKRMSVTSARAMAKKAHGTQKDKLGYPYMGHLEAVRLGVQVLGGDKHEQIAALLHDVLEDTKLTEADLVEAGISGESLKIVIAVTKGVNEAQTKYLDRIITAGDGAMRVKLADLLHNTRHDRLEELKNAKPGVGGAYTVKRLLRKYRPAMARLQIELGLIGKNADVDTIPEGTATGSYGYGTSYGSGAKQGQIKAAASTMLAGEWPENWKSPAWAKAEEAEDGFYKVECLDGTVKEVKGDSAQSLWSKTKWMSGFCSGITEADRKRALELALEVGDVEALAHAKDWTVGYGIETGKFVKRPDAEQSGIVTEMSYDGSTQAKIAKVLWDDGVEAWEFCFVLSQSWPSLHTKAKLTAMAFDPTGGGGAPNIEPVKEAVKTSVAFAGPTGVTRYVDSIANAKKVYCIECKHSLERDRMGHHENTAHKLRYLGKDDAHHKDCRCPVCAPTAEEVAQRLMNARVARLAEAGGLSGKVDLKTFSRATRYIPSADHTDFMYCQECKALTSDVESHERLAHPPAISNSAELSP